MHHDKTNDKMGGQWDKERSLGPQTKDIDKQDMEPGTTEKKNRLTTTDYCY